MYGKYNFGGLRIPTDIANNRNLEWEIRAFMYIVSFKESGLISRVSALALFRNLREGKLLRKVNTYHCPINEKWYNDDFILNVYEDVYHTNKIVSCVDMRDVVAYANLYYNLPVAQCFKWLLDELISPFIENLMVDKLKEFGFDTPTTTYEPFDTFRTSGYCCSDCDGCFEDYKTWKYNHYVADQTKEYYWEVIRNLKKDFSK